MEGHIHFKYCSFFLRENLLTIQIIQLRRLLINILINHEDISTGDIFIFILSKNSTSRVYEI